MRILWLSWKDLSHPQAGGAEVVAHELAKRLVSDGHSVTFLVAGFANCTQEEMRDGYRIIRTGNRYTVYWHAYRYYKKHLRHTFDLIIEEINTVPFFSRLYAREKKILFIHQLARQIWFYQMPFPFSVIGYLLEPVYLWLLRKHTVITVSDSTKNDLTKLGFSAGNIHIMSEGIQIEPITDLARIQKYSEPTLLSLGAIRPMKRTLHVVKAFEHAKHSLPALRLMLAGDASGPYAAKVLEYITHSPYRDDIEITGRVSTEKKMELMQRAHLVAVTSVREGWGLVVTEANSQGTPAIVYNVHGLRDSVRDDITGLVSKHNTPRELAHALTSLLQNKNQYDTLRKNAWDWSKKITFEKSYADLTNILFPV